MKLFLIYLFTSFSLLIGSTQTQVSVEEQAVEKEQISPKQPKDNLFDLLNSKEMTVEKKAEIYNLINETTANAQDEQGRTPLHLAIINGFGDIAATLAPKTDIKKVDHLNNTALHYAAGEGLTDLVKYIIKNGANINAKNIGGLTPLHYAAQYGKFDVVNELLNRGADVNCKDGPGCTPLYYAAEKGYRDIVELLIKRGAIVSAYDVLVAKGFGLKYYLTKEKFTQFRSKFKKQETIPEEIEMTKMGNPGGSHLPE